MRVVLATVSFTSSASHFLKILWTSWAWRKQIWYKYTIKPLKKCLTTYLLRASSFTSTNGPDWFISNNYILPIAYFILNSFDLLSDNSFSLSSFTFFKSFTNTCNNRQSRFESMIYFFSNKLLKHLKQSSINSNVFIWRRNPFIQYYVL